MKSSQKSWKSQEEQKSRRSARLLGKALDELCRPPRGGGGGAAAAAAADAPSLPTAMLVDLPNDEITLNGQRGVVDFVIEHASAADTERRADVLAELGFPGGARGAVESQILGREFGGCRDEFLTWLSCLFQEAARVAGERERERGPEHGTASSAGLWELEGLRRQNADLGMVAEQSWFELQETEKQLKEAKLRVQELTTQLLEVQKQSTTPQPAETAEAGTNTAAAAMEAGAESEEQVSDKQQQQQGRVVYEEASSPVEESIKEEWISRLLKELTKAERDLEVAKNTHEEAIQSFNEAKAKEMQQAEAVKEAECASRLQDLEKQLRKEEYERTMSDNKARECASELNMCTLKLEQAQSAATEQEDESALKLADQAKKHESDLRLQKDLFDVKLLERKLEEEDTIIEKARLQGAEEALADYELELKRAKESNLADKAEAQRQVDDIKEEMKKMREEFEKKQQEHEDVIANLTSTAQGAASERVAALSAMDEFRKRYESANERSQGVLRKLEKEKANLEEQLQNSSKASGEERQSMQEQVEKRDFAIALLKAEMQGAENMVSDFEGILEQKERAEKDMRDIHIQETNRLREEIQRLGVETRGKEKLKKEHEKQRGTIAVLQTKHKRLESEMETLKSKLEEQFEQNAASKQLRVDMKRLTSELNERSRQNDERGIEIDKLRANLKQKTEEWEAKIKELGEESRREGERLQQENKKEEVNQKALREKIRELQAEKQARENAPLQYDPGCVTYYEGVLKGLEAELEKKKVEIERLEDKLSSAQQKPPTRTIKKSFLPGKSNYAPLLDAPELELELELEPEETVPAAGDAPADLPPGYDPLRHTNANPHPRLGPWPTGEAGEDENENDYDDELVELDSVTEQPDGPDESAPTRPATPEADRRELRSRLAACVYGAGSRDQEVDELYALFEETRDRLLAQLESQQGAFEAENEELAARNEALQADIERQAELMQAIVTRLGPASTEEDDEASLLSALPVGVLPGVRGGIEKRSSSMSRSRRRRRTKTWSVETEGADTEIKHPLYYDYVFEDLYRLIHPQILEEDMPEIPGPDSDDGEQETQRKKEDMEGMREKYAAAQEKWTELFEENRKTLSFGPKGTCREPSRLFTHAAALDTDP